MVEFDDPFNKQKQIIFKVLQDSTNEQDVQLIEGGDHADLASTIAFSLAKKRKTSPV